MPQLSSRAVRSVIGRFGSRWLVILWYSNRLITEGTCVVACLFRKQTIDPWLWSSGASPAVRHSTATPAEPFSPVSRCKLVRGIPILATQGRHASDAFELASMPELKEVKPACSDDILNRLRLCGRKQLI